MSASIEWLRPPVLLFCGAVLVTGCTLGVGSDSDPDPDLAHGEGAIRGRWILDTDPTVTVGGMDGEGRIHQLPTAVEGLRSSRARFLSDERFVIADAGDNELRIHGADGSLAARLGGTGAGPGEFRRLDGVGVFAGGDSLVAWESGRLGGPVRVTVFSAEGELARVFTTPGGAHTVVLGVFDNGSLLTAPRMGLELRNDTAGIIRPAVELQVLSSDGVLVGAVGPFPGREIFFSGRGAEQATPFFPRETLVGVGARRVYTADSGSFGIAAHDPEDGSLVWEVSRPFTAVAVDPAEVLGLREIATTAYAQAGGGAAQFLVPADEIPARPTYPVLAELLEDEAGNLWVLHRMSAAGSGDQTWSVFSQEGSWLGDLEVPRFLDLLAVGDGSVLAATRDALGVISVQRHRLSTP